VIDETFVQEIARMEREKQTVRQFHGLDYSTEAFKAILPPLASAISAQSLQAVVDYITADPDDMTGGKMIVQVVSPTEVKVLGALNPTTRQRETLLTVTPDVPQFRYGTFYDIEAFIIALASIFEKTDDRDYLGKLISDLKIEESVQQTDDGLTQKVVAKVGIAKVEAVEVKNPLTLKPFRSFTEIDQVETKFLVRMRKQEGITVALFEADGGAWRIEAMRRIAEFLEEKLTSVTILA
jgi:hypothetical protein